MGLLLHETCSGEVVDPVVHTLFCIVQCTKDGFKVEHSVIARLAETRMINALHVSKLNLFAHCTNDMQGARAVSRRHQRAGGAMYAA